MCDDAITFPHTLYRSMVSQAPRPRDMAPDMPCPLKCIIKSLILLLCIDIGVVNMVQAQLFESAYSLGDTDNDVSSCVTFMSNGNIATAGMYRGNISANGFSISSSNFSWDAYVAVHDSAGVCVGMISIGTNNAENARHITSLANGNIVVAGIWNSFNGCVNCTWFITCIDPSTMTVIWNKTLGVTGGRINELKARQNRIVITADIYGPNFINLGDTAVTSLSAKSGLLWVLNETGETLWAHSFGNQMGDDISLLRSTFDSDGNIAVSGEFRYSASIADTVIFSSGGFLDDDSFIVQFNPQGNRNWLYQSEYDSNNDGWHLLSFSPELDKYFFGIKFYDSGFAPPDSVHYVKLSEDGQIVDEFNREYSQPWLVFIQPDLFYELKEIVPLGVEYIALFEERERDAISDFSSGWSGAELSYSKLFKLDSNMVVSCNLNIPIPASAYGIFDFDIDELSNRVAITGAYSQPLSMDTLSLSSPVGAQDAFTAVRTLLQGLELELPEDTVLLNAPMFALSGINVDIPGSYFGNGVISDSIFNPLIAGIGAHEITWAYSDGDCTYVVSDSIYVVSTTYIKPSYEETLVLAYPNPCDDQLRLEGTRLEDQEVLILDSSSRRTRIYMQGNVIDVGDVSPGLYTAFVVNENRTIPIRFVRQ